jgi:hypothetical protein
MFNNNKRVALKDLVASQTPEFIRAQYPTFVTFLEAYYEYLDNNSVDLKKIRDIDQTLDEFIKYFKAELAHNYPVNSNTETERYLLKHIRDQYLSKGSEASYKLLFRLLFSKDVYMDYPGKQMLRVSDGRWQQDVSLFVRVDTGNAFDLIGKIVDIQTSRKIYRSKAIEGYDYSGISVTKVTANIENVILFKDNIYEIFLNRNFYGEILPGDVVKYGSDFQGQILPTTAKIKIQNKGRNFKPGMVFQVSSGEGTPIWFKVLTIETYYDKDGNAIEGGLKTIDLIRFGIGYSTDFSLTVLPTSAVSTKKKITRDSVSIQYSVIPKTVAVITLNSGGSGYTQVPTVEIGGVGGSGATAHAVIEDGVVTQIILDTNGRDYESAYVNITAQPGDTGSGAEAEATIGNIYDYSYIDKTSGFTEGGYLNLGDYWDVTESGRNATATATLGSGLMEGQVAGLNLTNGGTGYFYSKPTVDICFPIDANGIPIEDGVKATAEAIVDPDTGVITGLTMTNYGSGYITTPTVRIVGSYGYANGAYVGTINRQFFVDAKDTTSADGALLNVTLDAVARYPGYYKTNDGFLDDAMYIQDSYYYQAFSYVIRIDQQLETYAAVVRTMLHPSGMALFGEYSINNKIDLGIALDSLVKSLGITLYDSVLLEDYHFYDMIKDLSDSNIYPLDFWEKITFGKYLEDSFGMSDPAAQLSRVLTKVFGLPLQTTEQVFAIEDGGMKYISKRTTDDTTSLVENYANKLTTKSFTDTPVISEYRTMDYTLNMIIDPLPGIYPETGYVVINSYEEGGYFAEIYANGYASTWSN